MTIRKTFNLISITCPVFEEYAKILDSKTWIVLCFCMYKVFDVPRGKTFDTDEISEMTKLSKEDILISFKELEKMGFVERGKFFLSGEIVAEVAGGNDGN